jgi:hypothetical protein
MNRNIQPASCGPDGKPDLDEMRPLLKGRDTANRLPCRLRHAANPGLTMRKGREAM